MLSLPNAKTMRAFPTFSQFMANFARDFRSNYQPRLSVMKKTIYSKFDKKEITNMPIAKFPGRIITIISAGEADRAVDFLLTHDILGIDSETRPSFKKGSSNKVSLLQVSTHDTCFLFRLNHIGLPNSIIRLLENKQVPMIGLSLANDMLALHERSPFKPGLFIDLQETVAKIGIKDQALQKLYANIFHEKISKRQRLSNWDADVLTDAQKMYAATDAWTCIRLYEEIERLSQTGDFDLIEVAEPEPVVAPKEPEDTPSKSETPKPRKPRTYRKKQNTKPNKEK